MIKAVGGEQMTLDGRFFWGVFDDDYQPVGFSDRAIYGREILVKLSADDVGDARRGSLVARANGERYAVESAPQPHDSGMVRLVLVAKQ